ncbi:GNAT family N-acetyltransferase [Dysgonomonas sp. 216]|uniref:GNAT family N-acetyltransferase n=1 Tax=Dysgonomonas sp. 216 TaxID=2302934 RepID=UPI0013D649A9|nr:GNAT family N-acetyltransferase [Dysgonomonas sp. 216]NDW19098.1 GNAT family N-acetyltransferase [Dysgonomonas sp. 216]
MIQFANDKTAPLVRDMWKTCFDDSDAFMELYFTKKYRNENTLIYFENGIAAASLQILPYIIRFYGKEIPCGYISGACTLPQYRGRGYMKDLLLESFRIMQDRNIPISILIPARAPLFYFYEKYGYTQVFDKGEVPLYFKSFLYKYPYDVKEAYTQFNKEYQQTDFCILKTEEDFKIIAEEYILDGCPAKYNLAGMARILDAWSLLSLYAIRNPRQDFRVKITDETLQTESIYHVQEATVSLIFGTEWDFEVDIQTLTRLLFGYHTNNMPDNLSTKFTEQHPVMNLMLE